MQRPAQASGDGSRLTSEATGPACRPKQEQPRLVGLPMGARRREGAPQVRACWAAARPWRDATRPRRLATNQQHSPCTAAPSSPPPPQSRPACRGCCCPCCRDPTVFHYKPIPCPDSMQGNACPRGLACGFAHNGAKGGGASRGGGGGTRRGGAAGAASTACSTRPPAANLTRSAAARLLTHAPLPPAARLTRSSAARLLTRSAAARLQSTSTTCTPRSTAPRCATWVSAPPPGRPSAGRPSADRPSADRPPPAGLRRQASAGRPTPSARWCPGIPAACPALHWHACEQHQMAVTCR